MAAPLAPAASLGAGGGGAVLGQWLDFAVQVQLDPTEDLTPECVNAEVTVGERRLPPPLVRTVLEAQRAGSARVRVLTLQAIDEPVVGVDLSVGCASRLSRNYVVLADPPGMALMTTAAVVSAPAFAHAPADAEVAVASQPASAPARAAAPVAGSQGVTVSDVAAGSTSSAPAPARRAAPRATAAAVPRAAARPPRRAKQRPTTSRPRAAMLVPVRGAVAAEAPARLTLDVAEATPGVEAAAVELALEAVAQAASAVRASAAAASAAAARMATLERTAERLGRQAQANRDEAAQLREQLARVDGGGRWMWPLLALAVLLAALAAWLAWRLSGLQRQRQRSWIDATAQPWQAGSQAQPIPSRPPTSPIPFVTSEIHASAPAAPAPRRRGVAAWPPAAPPETWTAPGALSQPPEPVEPPPDPATTRTEVMPAAVPPGDTSPRDVSIDELIDLEQQAEFFVVLGQDEAAIDLLVQHLRDTGGGSPLPYLKLLEIQHRRGDRDAYERTRARFNLRFNAYAPGWGQDMRAGRSLEDYAGVLPRLQQVWPRPLDAMAELEALLFRKSRGELFDLPAYREVLFLYALARDRLDREPVDANNVDLLLPLADGGEFSATAPAPLGGLGQDGAAAHPGPDDRPTAPVDLDLTQAAPTASIFDPQDTPLPGSRP
ncbi:MAG: hypothetical protein Q8M01_15275 [Rubrivivax sp.]|nr:hypothetical protein [Rubrivivax sp.]